MSGHNPWLAVWVESLKVGHVITEADVQRFQRVGMAIRKGDQHHRQARDAAAEKGRGGGMKRNYGDEQLAELEKLAPGIVEILIKQAEAMNNQPAADSMRELRDRLSEATEDEAGEEG